MSDSAPLPRRQLRQQRPPRPSEAATRQGQPNNMLDELLTQEGTIGQEEVYPESMLDLSDDLSGLADRETNVLNSDDFTTLPDPPVLPGNATSNMWGSEAMAPGRASSPRLAAQAAAFPGVVQFRVWRMENGHPASLGVIEADASEEDFVDRFYHAMPQEGDTRFQFRLRPVDLRGKETGHEFTITISEHHADLQRLRRKKNRKPEEERSEMYPHPYPFPPPGNNQPVIVQPAASSGSEGTFAEEMGRMFEQAVGAADRQNELLRTSLESERERLRMEEKERAEERVRMASNSAEVVQRMTERLMATDQTRAKEQMAAQKEQSNLMMTTLTTVFAQQQEAARAQATQMRELDNMRMKQDQARADQLRKDEADRRAQERDEWVRRLEMERQRAEDEFKRIEANRQADLAKIQADAEHRRLVEKEESERRRIQEREIIEERRRLDQAEKERWERDWKERQEREATEREERRRQDLMDREQRQREWAEKQERDREEREEKRRRETEEWERRRAQEREELQRRESEQRERVERERLMWQQQIEAQKVEMENRRLTEERRAREEREAWERRLQLEREEANRKEALRREELQRESERRREEMQLQLKQMEMQAQRDREHQEKLAHMAQLERDQQREALLSRERAEAEERRLAEAARQRQHEMVLREMEITKERDREHAERMMQLTRAQNGDGMDTLGETLGMSKAEVLQRIFSPPVVEGGGSNWSDSIAKMVGSLADVGKAVVSRGGGAAPAPKPPQKPSRPTEPMVQVQTPQGAQIMSLADAKKMGFIPDFHGTAGAAGAALPPPNELDALLQREQPVPAAVAPRKSQQRTVLNPVPVTLKESKPTIEETALTPAPTRDLPLGAEPKAHPYDQSALVDIKARLKEAAIPLMDQRDARRGIRDLAHKLNKANQTEWSDIVTSAIIAKPAILTYIMTVGLYTALFEAQVDASFADQIVDAIRQHDMTPADFAYTEEDYQRAHAVQENT